MNGTTTHQGRQAWQQASLLALVLLFATCVFSIPVADNDLWGHVYFGRAILAEGSLPPVNRYSYTAPDFPWINHEILAECIFAWVFDDAGALGLLVLKTLTGVATLAVIARITIRRVASPLAWGAALLWASSLMAWGFLVRPQIFSSLALALVWDRLEAHDTRRRASSLLALPLLFAIWINTHGAAVAGLGVLLVYVALDRLRTPLAEWRSTALIGGLCALALLANPYGIRLLQFLWADLTRSRAISEWQPIPLIDASFLSFKLAVVALVASLFLVRERRPWEVAILGVAAFMTFRHQRHLPLFGVIAAPRLGETLQELVSRWPSAVSARIARWLLLAALLAVAVCEIGRAVKIHYRLRGQIFVAPEQFPIYAVDFLERNQLSGNLLLPFDWGEYAIWHLYPRCRVSVDGRYTTAYPRQILDASQRFFVGAPGWEESLPDATIVLMDRRQPNALSLFAKPEWAYVYSDPTALVFVRREALGEKPLLRPVEASGEPVFP
jgi:hypothetical protein